MARPRVRDDEGLSTFWSFVGVLVLVIAILAVYFVYVIPKFGHPPLRAQSGDQVKVDYVGRFEDGFVFDTSLASVPRTTRPTRRPSPSAGATRGSLSASRSGPCPWR